MILLREMRLRGAGLEIENEGDLLDLVLEDPGDLERLRFRWSQLVLDMGNDGLVGSLSEWDLSQHIQFLSAALSNLTGLVITLFPSPMVRALAQANPGVNNFFISAFPDSPRSDVHLSWTKSCFKVNSEAR